MADHRVSRSSSTSGSCKPTESSKGVPVISMFSITYWKKKKRGISGLAELAMAPTGEVAGFFWKSCRPSLIVSGIVLSVLSYSPKKEDLGAWVFQNNRVNMQQDEYAEEICTTLIALGKVLFPL